MDDRRLFSYFSVMFEDLRARASLLFLIVAAFLLILISVPRWDSGWVQAFGSIFAIGAGFSYVALQDYWARRDRAAREAEFRHHVGGVCASISLEMRAREAQLIDARGGGRGISQILGRDSLDILADELVGVSPTDCGSANFAMAARQASLFARAYVHVMMTMTDRAITEDDMRNVRQQHAGFDQALGVMGIEAVSRGDDRRGI